MSQANRTLAVILSLACVLVGKTAFADRIVLDGSISMIPALAALGEAYHSNQRSTQIVNERSVEEDGITKLAQGKIEIARVSGTLRPSELVSEGQPLNPVLIGYQAVAIIAHPLKGSITKTLVRRQIKDIFFGGLIQKWEQLNPNLAGNINVYGRVPSNSQTDVVFFNLVSGNSYLPLKSEAVLLDSDDAVIASVARDENGLGYVSLSSLIRSKLAAEVKMLDYGTEWGHTNPPSIDNVREDRYKLSHRLYLVTKKSSSKAVSDFTDYVVSGAGQKLLSDQGLIPLK